MAGLGKAQRRGQAGSATAEDQDVGFVHAGESALLVFVAVAASRFAAKFSHNPR
jgi:hypothetical protein